MSKSDTFENDLLKLIFNGTAIANLADNAASSPLGSLYLALHTADPGESGVQTTSEATYTGYARQAVLRSSSGFTVAGSSVTLAANVDFPARSDAGAEQNLTHFSIGVAVSGATKILYKGAISVTLDIGQNDIPRLTTGTTVTED